ncbi:MAG: radical SAM protein [Oscillospiraceae bacterium]|nr:radical SAM protein [Oscillospiraceae bacterium]
MEIQYIPAKTIVTAKKSTQWFGADHNMNIYRGCCHGCIYCDSRSDCYREDNFDVVKAKEDALRIIRDELRRKVRSGIISTGSMSDPYNPFEEELKLTRHSLELINAFKFGVTIATKSPLVTRDIDILQDIKKHSPLLVKMTITTADDELCKKLEPNVAPTSERIAALKTLSDAGIYCGILMMPILPYINDTEESVLSIVNMAKECGAKFVYPSFGVTMRDSQREYFYSKLKEIYPELVETYKKKFGTYYKCSSPHASKLWNIFKSECDRLGLLYDIRDITSSYKIGYGDIQFSFFKD